MIRAYRSWPPSRHSLSAHSIRLPGSFPPILDHGLVCLYGSLYTQRTRCLYEAAESHLFVKVQRDAFPKDIHCLHLIPRQDSWLLPKKISRRLKRRRVKLWLLVEDIQIHEHIIQICFRQLFLLCTHLCLHAGKLCVIQYLLH